MCILAAGLSSCAVRRVFTRLHGGSPQPLLTASKASLIDAVAKTYGSVHDLNATVNLTPAIGSAEKNKITEYKDVRAYIMFRKPASIRIIGLAPFVRVTAFDMVAENGSFALFIPDKNRFLVGNDDVVSPTASKLETLRPKHFLEALLVRPFADPSRLMLENFTDEDNAFYILHEVAEKNGQLLLRRSVWFERVKLAIVRQLLYDDNGDIISDARYDSWRAWDNVPFPQRIAVDRPRDEYSMVLDVVKMDINKGLTDDKFVLKRPEGSTMERLGAAPANGGSQEPARK